MGLYAATVIAPACHDTGSAVAAVPTETQNYAWISSGTWSIVGAEVLEPIINAQSLAYNFTNEGGVADTFRFCKNVAGLWLVQECRREWARQGQEYSYSALVEMAERAPAFVSLLDPDDELFMRPGGMPSRIAEFCKRTNQPVPQEPGAFVRAALEGIALKYRTYLGHLEKMHEPFDTIHIIGGGTQNKLLNQLTADATGKHVVTGPIEATALGNVLMQLLALGHIASLAQGRQVIRQSFALTAYEPRDSAAWDDAFARFQKISGA
jgi:rhamnulokinase